MVAPLIAMLAGGAFLGGNRAYQEYDINKAKKKRTAITDSILEEYEPWEQQGPGLAEPGQANPMLQRNSPLDQAGMLNSLLGAGNTLPQANMLMEARNPQQAEQLSQPDRFKMSQDLAKQRTGALSAYVDQRSQAQKTMTSLQQGTGAGDLAAVISFNKSLDPSSVVRESEQKATTGAAGPIERFRGLLSDVEGRGALSEKSRRQMAELIAEIQQNEAAYANNIVTDYNNRAQNFGLNAADIRGGQLGYGPQGNARTEFNALTVPQSIFDADPNYKPPTGFVED